MSLTDPLVECHCIVDDLTPLRPGLTKLSTQPISLITVQPFCYIKCNSRPSGVALASCRATNQVQTVSPRAQGPDWSGAGLHITILLMPVTNIPSRSSVCL